MDDDDCEDIAAFRAIDAADFTAMGHMEAQFMAIIRGVARRGMGEGYKPLAEWSDEDIVAYVAAKPGMIDLEAKAAREAKAAKEAAKAERLAKREAIKAAKIARQEAKARRDRMWWQRGYTGPTIV